MVRVTVCNKTGLRAGSGCGATRTVLVPEGMAPALVCDAHVSIDFCTESERPANEYCPEDLRETHWAVDLSAPNTAQGFGYTRELITRPLTGDQYQYYADQVEWGMLDRVPDGAPIYASDSDSVLSDIQTMIRCTIHNESTVTQEDPDGQLDPEDPENPVNWFGGGTTEPGGGETSDPDGGTTEPGGGTDPVSEDPQAPGTEEPSGGGEESGESTGNLDDWLRGLMNGI